MKKFLKWAQIDNFFFAFITDHTDFLTHLDPNFILIRPLPPNYLRLNNTFVSKMERFIKWEQNNSFEDHVRQYAQYALIWGPPTHNKIFLFPVCRGREHHQNLRPHVKLGNSLIPENLQISKESYIINCNVKFFYSFSRPRLFMQVRGNGTDLFRHIHYYFNYVVTSAVLLLNYLIL